jgi:hypothetical protein
MVMLFVAAVLLFSPSRSMMYINMEKHKAQRGCIVGTSSSLGTRHRSKEYTLWVNERCTWNHWPAVAVYNLFISVSSVDVVHTQVKRTE